MKEEQIVYLLKRWGDKDKEVPLTMEQKDKKMKKRKDLKLKRINSEGYPTNKSFRKTAQRTCKDNIDQTHLKIFPRVAKRYIFKTIGTCDR